MQSHNRTQNRVFETTQSCELVNDDEFRLGKRVYMYCVCLYIQFEQLEWNQMIRILFN